VVVEYQEGFDAVRTYMAGMGARPKPILPLTEKNAIGGSGLAK